MLRVAHPIQLFNQLIEAILLESDTHVQHMVRRGVHIMESPTARDVSPCMLDLEVIPAFFKRSCQRAYKRQEGEKEPQKDACHGYSRSDQG
jgi:hypothetical protein